MPDDPLLSTLLFEQEGTALDFKREQYRFYGASDSEKAELLKDILSFTNAWRRSDAYILIGVEERVGSKALVVGTSDHLKDADLQQFVNSKTNAPVDGSYTTCSLEGKSVGVIRVPQQERPRFILKPFGGLLPNTVYLRRGSSTGTAAPDEIAKMGVADRAAVTLPQLSVLFADAKNRAVIGNEIDLAGTFIDMGDVSALPDYSESSGPFDMPGIYRVNRHYFRDFAEYTVARELARPCQFAIRNDSSVPAVDVRVELIIQSSRALLFDADSWPSRPESREYDSFASHLGRLKNAPPLDVVVKKLTNNWVVDLRVDKVQPNATAWLDDTLYFGSEITEIVTLEGTIAADNLPTPQPVALFVTFTSTPRKTSFWDVKEADVARKR